MLLATLLVACGESGDDLSGGGGSSGSGGAAGSAGAAGDGGTSGDAGSSHGVDPSAHPAFASVDLPAIVGHGGAKRLCSENTLPCFQLAIDLGAQAMEADLQVLGDGTLVMFHDDNAAEQTGTDRLLLDMTLADLGALDAGWGFTPDDGATFPERGQGLVVPTFREFLDAFPALPVLLDVKPESAEMAAALRKYVTDEQTAAEAERVYIKTNDPGLADELRALAPAAKIAFSSGERVQLFVAPDSVEHIPPSWIDLNPPQITSDVRDWARQRDHVFTASTVDETADMQALLDADLVDGIVTNRPDRLAELLGR